MMQHEGFRSEEQDLPIEGNVTEQAVVSITEAARLHGVTRQAIYVAIKQNKLRASKDVTRWTIHLRDLDEYRRNKYSRTKSMFDGEPLFDNTRGYFSVNQTAAMLNVPAQKVYYATRVGHLKATRKGAAWVISMEEIKQYREKYLSSCQKSEMGA